MQYEVYGEFDIPRSGSQVDCSAISQFWFACDDYNDGLSTALGVYVFSLRHGKSWKPWYVGRTLAKTGFKGEVFQPHKLTHYNDVLRSVAGIPTMHFVARRTASGDRFSAAGVSARSEIIFVEKSIIGMALRANSRLCNVKETHYLRNCRIPGLMGPTGSGRYSSDASKLRRAMKLSA